MANTAIPLLTFVHEQEQMYYGATIDNMQDKERNVLDKNYNENKYGFPILEDNTLFGRLFLEIN